MAQEVRNNLKEVALTYSFDNAHLTTCASDFDPENRREKDKGCYVEISIGTLKKEGLFEDDRGFCNTNNNVIVYRYNDGVNSEYRAYVSEDACNN